jgi:hypothetical protein
VSAPELDALRERGDAFMQALSREQYLAGSGRKREAELVPIYERFARVTGAESLELVRAAFDGSGPATDDHRAARMLLEWQADAHASREVAPVDERIIAWESSAIVRTQSGRAVPYSRVAIEIAAEHDRAERLALDLARAATVRAELVPLRQERLQRERDAVLALDLAPTYDATFTRLSGVDVAALADACDALLRDTRAMWDDVAPAVVRAGLDIGITEATRADALALLRASEYDAYFPARESVTRVERQVREMGIDPTAAGRIVLDVADREGKRSRAFCAPVRVPDEVYLVLRPHGGASDWRTFLHELGHALHFGYARPELPFEARWLGDNAVTESYAMLFDHRMLDRRWLLRYTELGRSRVDAWLRHAAFEELHFLRRYAAKLRYELELYRGDVPWDALPELYVELLSDATSFRYRSADAFVDVDPGFYSARYLRAWQLQARLASTLVERFDEDWWRNPRAGPWMVTELFGDGQRELAEELSARVSGETLSFDPVVRAVEQRLG